RDGEGADVDREVDDDDIEGDEAREGGDTEVDGSHEDAERIRFSRQKDLQSYRAASRSRSAVGFGSSQESQEQHGGLGYGNDSGYERSCAQSYDQIPHISPDDESPEENPKAGLRDRILTMSLDRESIQIVPAIILLSLIVALVLTFYTRSIPEYPGALASSILIVTLIIYGAATLLKA
ncbi:MAG: hypothetical protein QUS09_04355, partial [Methanotrichaceae archaeon]|nr:hypothetical protein [Methanotrichaceae archaeon]